MVTLKQILLVNTACSSISLSDSVRSGPVGEPFLLYDMFTVRGMLNLSVSVHHLMPRTDPPNFCTIGPSLSPEQAITLRTNPPIAYIAASVPVVCQSSIIFPLSLSMIFLLSEPLGWSSTNLSSKIIVAATMSQCL